VNKLSAAREIGSASDVQIGLTWAPTISPYREITTGIVSARRIFSSTPLSDLRPVLLRAYFRIELWLVEYRVLIKLALAIDPIFCQNGLPFCDR